MAGQMVENPLNYNPGVLLMKQTKQDAAHENPMMTDDFLRFISGVSGLLWRLDRQKKQVRFFNKAALEVFDSERKAAAMLLDLIKAQEIVVGEDFFRFKLFIKSMREATAASVLFRVRDKQGQDHWLKMSGFPGTRDRYYYGYIQDITGDVTFIYHALEKDQVRRTMIQQDDHPVLLVDMKSKAVISRNTHAYRLFEYNFDQFEHIAFRDLFPAGQASRVSAAYETCLLEGAWTGKLHLLKKGDEVFEARVKLKRLALRDRNLLRLSIYETFADRSTAPGKANASAPGGEQFQEALMEAMEGKDEMPDILETLMAHPYGDFCFDAVIYADVHEKKGKVDIYAGGELFAGLAHGVSYNYEGTISQAIRENRLEYLILDDTLESTKPIDWALFIPHGIRSYFARPFFHGSRLRTLLIFCSSEVNRFSEKRLELYELYYPAFLKGLRNWRGRKKKPGKPPGHSSKDQKR
jgi:transcription termination factor NusB